MFENLETSTKEFKNLKPFPLYSLYVSYILTCNYKSYAHKLQNQQSICHRWTLYNFKWAQSERVISL